MLRKALAGLIAGATLVAPALGQSVDEVIAMVAEARGGLAKLKAVQSVEVHADGASADATGNTLAFYGQVLAPSLYVYGSAFADNIVGRA